MTKINGLLIVFAGCGVLFLAKDLAAQDLEISIQQDGKTIVVPAGSARPRSIPAATQPTPRRDIRLSLKPIPMKTQDNPYKYSVQVNGSTVDHGFVDTLGQGIIQFLAERFDVPQRCHVCDGQFKDRVFDHYHEDSKRWILSCGCVVVVDVHRTFLTYEKRDEHWHIRVFHIPVTEDVS